MIKRHSVSQYNQATIEFQTLTILWYISVLTNDLRLEREQRKLFPRDVALLYVKELVWFTIIGDVIAGVVHK